MDAIVNFFKGIADTVVSLVDLLFAFIEDFLTFLKILAKLPSLISQLVIWVPAEAFATLSVILSIAILYKILGRD